MEGRLFVYQHGLCAFQSGNSGSDKHLVVMGGLTDGLLATPYVPALSAFWPGNGTGTFLYSIALTIRFLVLPCHAQRRVSTTAAVASIGRAGRAGHSL